MDEPRTGVKTLHIFRHWLSFTGVLLAAGSAALFVVLYGVEVMGFAAGPYTGIIAFIILPTVFVLGLVLVPVGLWKDRARRRRAAEGGAPLPEFPVLDFNQAAVRGAALAVLGTAGAALVLLSVGTYKGVQTLHSTRFCATGCHDLMTPEYTANQRSPHAAVACSECHVGPGVAHFVTSKFTGVRQLVEFTFDRYDRPVRPPSDLRAAPQTCGQCHSPTRLIGDKLKMWTTYADDEANTAKHTVMMLKVGGPDAQGRWHGAHWHASGEGKISYLSDASRDTVYAVRLEAAGAPTRLFKGPGADAALAAAKAGDWRTMDCMDCHNRKGHRFDLPTTAVDQAMALGKIDPSLPFAKREGVKALQASYPTREEAAVRVPEALAAFYREKYPEVAKDKEKEVAAAGNALAEIYAGNVFPDMKVGWGTYVDRAGHERGCYRCHDNEHVTEAGEKVPKRCGGCHTVIADQEKEPEVLEVLYPE